MEKLTYKKIVDEITPKPEKTNHALLAFLSGGLVGACGEILRALLVNYYNVKNTDAISIVLFIAILTACFFTAFYDFDKYVIKYKAGLFVPISGFAHATTSSALEYKKEGFVFGIGSNIFKLSGSVILYGIVSAYIFGIIRYIFFGG